jgi:hypothetical protein
MVTALSSRGGLWVAGAILMLTGCGGSAAFVSPLDAPGAGHWVGASDQHAPAHRFKDQNLLYVSDGDRVDLFTYPDGTYIGAFVDLGSVSGECSDAYGDVFVTDPTKSEVLVFMRGVLSEPQVVKDPGEYPASCSIDPKTQALAVASPTNTGSKAGNVVVYATLEAKPKKYEIPDFYNYWSCAYDQNGNLFVDGNDDKFPLPHVKLAVLANGNSTFRKIKIEKKLSSAGPIQWVDKSLSFGDPDGHVVYQFQINGSQATVAGVTRFKGGSPLGKSWIQKSTGGTSVPGYTLMSPPTGGKGDLAFWSYPAGGRPTKLIWGFTGPAGATVSVAPK